MKTYTLELTFEELQDLYETLFCRREELREEIKAGKDTISEIASRQLKRLEPINLRVESLFPPL